MESHDNRRLTCEAFENRVHQILDDRLTLTGDARLIEHAAHCVACETMLLDYDCFDDSTTFLKSSSVEVTCIVEGDGTDRLPFQPLRGLAVLAAALLICFNLFGSPSDRSDGFAQRHDVEESATVTPPAITQLAMLGDVPTRQPAALVKRRVTPDTSPFSPNFRVADNIPRLPSATDWENVTKPFETLKPVLTYSSELPGIKTIHCTLNVTIELLRRSLESKPDEFKLGLG